MSYRGITVPLFQRTEPPARLGSRAVRAMLFCTTAWACSVPAALAQTSINAQPQNGRVVAGNASIAQTRTVTRIDQTSPNAAIDWRSFDVGSGQLVRFVQPSASAITLNRVTGPDPSQISGQIAANGQIVLVNPAGVVFTKGAQVSAQSVIVSAAGISNQNLMAGRMVFDQPGRPDAAIVNEGRITVRQAGLAALVAPRVRNTGVIAAKMGHVVLGGAETHTLDLYGDGLLSFDITGQVRQAPADKNGATATALVTNTGTIRADGGTVLLSAAAADGVIQTLVTAGGKITAPTAGGQTGSISIRGTGGSVQVDARVLARGRQPGASGGQIEVVSTANTVLTARASLDASGKAGGGTIAVGTALARGKASTPATPAKTAAKTLIAPGASILANATVQGDGGSITVLSSTATDMAGRIAAKGGPLGGNGGSVEVSGERGFSLTGAVDVSAPAGRPGSILLDPAILTVIAGTSGGGDQDSAFLPNGTLLAGAADTPLNQISNGAIQSLTGDIVLQASQTLTVAAPITLTATGQALSLRSGNLLTINTGAPVNTSGPISLTAGAGGINLGATVTGTIVDLNTTGGGVTSTAGVTATALRSTAGVTGTVSLSGFNAVASLGGIAVTGGSFALFNTVPTTVAGTVTVPASSYIYLETSSPNGITFGPAGALRAGASGRVALLTDRVTNLGAPAATGIVSAGADGTFELAPYTRGGAVTLGAAGSGLSLVSLNGITAGTVRIGAAAIPPSVTAAATTAGSVTIGGPFDAGTSQTLSVNAATFTGSTSPAGTGAIAVSAAVTAPNIVMNATGTIAINADVGGSATQTVTFLGNPNSTVADEAGAGRIVTHILMTDGTVSFDPATVTWSATGGILSAGLRGPNQIDQIGTFVTSGLNLTDQRSLTVTGAVLVNNPNGAGISVTGDFALGTAASLGQILLIRPATSSGTNHFLRLAVTGAVSEPNGYLSASLTGSAGSVDLSQSATGAGVLGPAVAGNRVSTIRAFTVTGGTGGFALTSNVALTVSGAVNAAGSVFSQTSDPAGITVAAAGSVNAGATARVSFRADQFAATGTGIVTGSIFELAPYTAGTSVILGATGTGLSLPSSAAITAGTIRIGAVTPAAGGAPVTTAGSIAVNGPFTAAGAVLDLNGRSVTQTATGVIRVAGLTGTVTGTADLSTAANLIPAVGPFTLAGGNLSLTNAAGQTLTVNGAISGATTVILTSPGGETLNAPVSATNIVLNSTGPIALRADLGDASTQTVSFLGDTAGTTVTETGTARIVTQTLMTDGAVTFDPATVSWSANGGIAAADLGGPNQIGQIGNFVSRGLTLHNTRSLAIAGTAFVANADGATLTVAGDLSFGTATSLGQFLALAPLGASGANNFLRLAVTGTVSVPNGYLVASLTGSAGSLDLSRSASGAGVVGPAAEGNRILMIGTLSVAGDFTLTNQRSIVLSGPLDVGGTLTLNIAQTTGSSITQTATGAITAARLTGSATGTVDLSTAPNAIPDLHTFTVTGGDFLLTTAANQTLTVSGPVTANNITLTAPGTAAIAVPGGLSVPSDTASHTIALSAGSGGIVVDSTIGGGTSLSTVVDLHTTGGGVTETVETGAIVAGVLKSTSGVTGTANLSGANDVATLAAFPVAGGDMILTNIAGTSLTVTGPVAANNIALTTSGTAAIAIQAQISSGVNGGTIAVAGGGGGVALAANVGGAAGTAGTTIDLRAANGDITQTAGALTASVLRSSGTTNKAVSLSQTGNVVSTLDRFAAGGDFTLDNGTNALTLAAPQTLGGYTLTLRAGAITQASGASVTAARLVIGSTGTVDLGTATNAVDILGAIATGGGFALNNGTTPLTVAASLNLGLYTLTLNAGSLDQAAGAIVTAATLTGRFSGAVDLGASANAVASLGGITAGGAFTLNNGTNALTIAAPLSIGANTMSLNAGPVTQAAAGIVTAATMTGRFSGAVDLSTAANAIAALGTVTAAGNLGLNNGTAALTIAGPIAIGGGTLTLNAGPIAQLPGATVTAGVLAGSASGAAGLAAAANAIASLGRFTAGGAFALNNGTNALALTAPLTIAGNTLSLTAGPVTQAAAAIVTAASLTGTFSGAIDLSTAANAIAALGTVTAAGNVSLNNATAALTIAGPLDTGGGTLTLTAGTIAEAPGAVITAATIQMAAAGGIALTEANRIGGLGRMTAGGPITVANAVSLAIAGTIAAPSLTLNVNGTIATSGGAVNVGTLSGGAQGLASFGAGATTIGTTIGTTINTLGSFTVSGGAFALNNQGPLTIAGPLSAQFIRISAPDQVTLSGTIATLGVPLSQQSGGSPAGPGSYIAVTRGDGETGGFVSTAGAAIVPFGGPAATLRIGIPGAGWAIALGGLAAPKAALVLDTGAGGTARGTLDVQKLLVRGSGGGADLFGTVAGFGGVGASSLATIAPRTDPAYTLNNCPIGLACAQTQYPPVVARVGDTLLIPRIQPGSVALAVIPRLGFQFGGNGDPDVVLPNISIVDY